MIAAGQTENQERDDMSKDDDTVAKRRDALCAEHPFGMALGLAPAVAPTEQDLAAIAAADASDTGERIPGRVVTAELAAMRPPVKG
jgi:hypothetical protein